MTTDVSDIVEDILSMAPSRQIAIIIVNGDTGEVKLAEEEDEDELLEPTNESIDYESEYFKDAFLEAIFGGYQAVVGGGGGGGTPAAEDAILMSGTGEPILRSQ